MERADCLSHFARDGAPRGTRSSQRSNPCDIHTGSWLGRNVLRPSVELAFLYGRLTRGVNLAEASPEQAVTRSHVPILLIHGLADDNIPPHQSEIIRDHSDDITLWEVPGAGHCGAVTAAYSEFNSRVLGWFSSHGGNAATLD